MRQMKRAIAIATLLTLTLAGCGGGGDGGASGSDYDKKKKSALVKGKKGKKGKNKGHGAEVVAEAADEGLVVSDANYSYNGLVVTFSLMLREGRGRPLTIGVTWQIHIDEGISRRYPKIRIG